MKKCLLLFTFTTIGTWLNAQTSLPDSGSYWTINWVSWDNSYPDFPIGLMQDTVIDNTTYKSIYKSADKASWAPDMTKYQGAVRDDHGKWYFRPPGDSLEHLVYDFSLQPGDTAQMYTLINQMEVTMIVDGMDTITMQNGVQRRRLMMNTQSAFPEEWIEGIGSNVGLMNAGYQIFDAGFQLICFHQRDTLIYLNSPNNTCWYAGINESGINPIQLSPNPAHDFVDISLEHYETGVTLSVTDELGRVMIQARPLQHDLRLPIGNLSPGLYLIEVHSGQTIYRKKLIVQ